MKTKTQFDKGQLQGYKNVRSWFRYFKYPERDPDAKRCPVCGGKLTTIRGRYPDMPKRKVCATCAMEIVESVVDSLVSNIEGPNHERNTIT